MRKYMKFIVVLDPAEEGGINVSVPALDGCFTQGYGQAAPAHLYTRRARGRSRRWQQQRDRKSVV